MTPTPPRPTGPPPSSGPPPAPPGAGGSGLAVSWKALAVALLVVIVGLGTVVTVVALSGDDEAAAAEEFTLEPTSTPGDNPFAPPVGTDQTGVTPPQGSGGTFSGDTAGLYGGTLNYSQCDPQQMITYLQQNPDKGRAWAQVQGISVEQISTYVSELTSVILRSDTYVTNHGFSNGRATVVPSVLQAGTAVMVDKYGTPRVKCYCGNPLRPPPKYDKPRYRGPQWSGFTPTTITIIQQTTVIIDTFVLVDPVTGQGFTRPAGTSGGSDQSSSPTPAPTPTPQPEPEPVPEPLPEPEPQGPSAEQQAIAKVQEAASACYPFPAPIEDSNEPPNIYTQPGDSTSFVLIADGTTVSGNFQEFIWRVDRQTLAFTPQNNFAQVASDHCPLLR